MSLSLSRKDKFTAPIKLNQVVILLVSFNYGDKLSQFVVENTLPHQRKHYCSDILSSFEETTSEVNNSMLL